MIKQMSKYFVGISKMFEEEKKRETKRTNKKNANCFEFAKLDETEAPW